MATIKEMTAYVNDAYHNVLTYPAEAKGMCYDVTLDVQDEFNIRNTIYSSHDNDPDYRFNILGQHCDHHALMHRGKVLDFTLRQFDPDSPYPFYGSVEEWKSILSRTWDTDIDHFILDHPDDSDIYR